ncbi:MAG: nucleotidyltransferase domain-containing protein [Paenibacillaceae bacterium]
MIKLNESQLTSLTSEEKIAISILKERLKKEFNVVKLILFGSKARGDYTEYSDVDLLVLVKESPTREAKEKLSDVQFATIMEQDAPLMSILENYNNWLEEVNVSLPLKDNIESEGIEIEI